VWRNLTFDARPCADAVLDDLDLVPRVVHIAGYNLLSLTRASAVVNCQSALM
jgi:hypothetical protein